MICTHLRWLEEALTQAGHRETSRGTPWTKNCREWVYFDAELDLAAIRAAFPVPDCLEDHENLDPRSGLERGLYCTTCQDAVVGPISPSARRFPEGPVSAPGG